MIGFWLAAALLMAATLALVLTPLLRVRSGSAPTQIRIDIALHRRRMDELEADLANGVIAGAEYDRARDELERAALEALDDPAPEPGAAPAASPVAAVVLALLVPTLAFGLYLSLGAPHSITSAPSPAADAGDPEQASHAIEEMVARLEARLERHPEDGEGWGMLGRSYAVLDRPEAAREAYAKAVRLRPDDPGLLIDYAAVLAQLQDGDLRGEAAEVLQVALKIAPDDPKGLWLAGIAALQAGEFAAAVDRLERFQGLQPLEGEPARIVAAALDRARAALGGAQTPVAAGAAAQSGLSVHVALAPGLAGRAEPADTVFVFARAAAGPRMPLAIVRGQIADLPMTVTLDDSSAMTPELRLSKYSEVVVGARVSKSGEATPRSGDLQGSSEVIDMRAVPSVEISIDQVIP